MTRSPQKPIAVVKLERMKSSDVPVCSSRASVTASCSEPLSLASDCLRALQDSADSPWRGCGSDVLAGASETSARVAGHYVIQLAHQGLSVGHCLLCRSRGTRREWTALVLLSDHRLGG